MVAVEATQQTDDRGELLTGEGGLLRTSPALRDKLAIFKSGLTLVARTHADDHDVISAIALARRLGHNLYPPKYVDLGAIRAAYASVTAAQAAAGPDTSETAMKKELMNLLREAARVNASDVHMVVNRGEARVYFRYDGERRPWLERPWPAAYGHQLCRTAYALADVADASYEQFAYQGARISTGLPEGLQAVRLQFNPVGFDGRQLVMRLLYARQSAGATLEALGFDEFHVRLLERMRQEPVGIIAVSGPTGSGKTTTLERMLRYMVSEFPGDHILSVEDPPEYLIPGVVQLPVSNAKSDEDRGEAFSEAIAAALRSDPDRIMIGEIRLKASATLAFRAAMTGHAVYTTVHANDALGIIPRFIDIGVDQYLLRDSSLVRGLLAQRLIRVLCDQCKVHTRLSDLPGDLGERLLVHLEEPWVYTVGPGCPHCRGGYKGRNVVAEILMPDDSVLGFLCNGLRAEAETYWKEVLGGRDMRWHGLEKIKAGVCDPTDVERKVGRL